MALLFDKISKDDLKKLYLVDNLSCAQIAKRVGYKSKKSISLRLKMLGIEIKNNQKICENVSGQIIGNMLVLSLNCTKNKTSYWNCKCINCGKEHKLAKQSISKTKCCKKISKIKDLNNKTFGEIKVLSMVGFSHAGHAEWNCICNCGIEFVTRGYNLSRGNISDCGHSKTYIGKEFGHLLVIDRDYESIGNKNPRWICECKCGKIKSITQQQLVSGQTISCGCAKSYYEELLFGIIKKLYDENHTIERNKSFKWLFNEKTRCYQRIDIVVSKNNAPILFLEYDGQQHFMPVRFESISIEKAKEKLKYTKKQDKRKTRLIEKNKQDGIFVRFNYKEKITDEYVEEKLKNAGVLIP